MAPRYVRWKMGSLGNVLQYNSLNGGQTVVLPDHAYVLRTEGPHWRQASQLDQPMGASISPRARPWTTAPQVPRSLAVLT